MEWFNFMETSKGRRCLAAEPSCLPTPVDDNAVRIEVQEKSAHRTHPSLSETHRVVVTSAILPANSIMVESRVSFSNFFAIFCASVNAG
jgi:hypothetical protein